MQPRHQARVIAIQTLFEVDLVGHDAERALANRLAEEPPLEGAAPFARKLVFGVLEHRPQIDEIIQNLAPEWPVDQVATIDRNILRVAIYEILLAGTPTKVAINEAVELAKLFGSESSQRFVNGVLGTLVRNRDKYRLEQRA